MIKRESDKNAESDRNIQMYTHICSYNIILTILHSNYKAKVY